MEKQVGGRGRIRHLKIFRPLRQVEQRQSAAPSRHRARDHERNSRAYYQPTSPSPASTQTTKAGGAQKKPAVKKHYARRQRVGPASNRVREHKQILLYRLINRRSRIPNEQYPPTSTSTKCNRNCCDPGRRAEDRVLKIAHASLLVNWGRRTIMPRGERQ